MNSFFFSSPLFLFFFSLVHFTCVYNFLREIMENEPKRERGNVNRRHKSIPTTTALYRLARKEGAR